MEFILFKVIHLVSVFVLFTCLVLELFLIQEQLSREKIKMLSFVDAIYGLSSLVILASGFYIALSVGKGHDFYFDNLSIYIKLFLFVFIGLLSIYPTVFFLKNRKGDLSELIVIPSNVKKIILIEILLVLCIPVFAVMLSNGVGI